MHLLSKTQHQQKPLQNEKIKNFGIHPLIPRIPSDFEFNLGLMPQWKYWGTSSIFIPKGIKIGQKELCGSTVYICSV